MYNVRLFGLFIALICNFTMAEETTSAEKETIKEAVQTRAAKTDSTVTEKTQENNQLAQEVSSPEKTQASNKTVVQPSTTVNKQFTASDFYQTTSIFGSSLNHDGSAVLVSSDQSGVFNLYKYPVDGSASTQLSDYFQPVPFLIFQLNGEARCHRLIRFGNVIMIFYFHG